MKKTDFDSYDYLFQTQKKRGSGGLRKLLLIEEKLQDKNFRQEYNISDYSLSRADKFITFYEYAYIVIILLLLSSTLMLLILLTAIYFDADIREVIYRYVFNW